VFGDGFDRVLAAARRGDESAWTRLYLDLAPALVGYLRGRGCPAPEDVASETMLQVVRDLRRFDGDESAFRSWVFTIAHHRLIDAARKAKARPARPVAHDALDEAAPPTPSFEDDALAALGPAELQPLLCACTADQREVLLLRYVADLSLQQVAEVLGKQYNAVKAVHRRALAALRTHLAEGTYPDTSVRTLTPSG
jgi:RNA polymerase sigma-70 factor (ECF subfamily)